MTAVRAATVSATLGLAGASWIVAVRQMDGMDMGAATELGSFASFVAVWVAMMAAMMLPGAASAVSKVSRADAPLIAVPFFAATYLAVWTAIGIVAYALYEPHGTSVAGALTIAAGLYELTPVKQHFRRRCRETVHSGFEFGFYCVGSSIGLMVMLLALGVMSIAWMCVVAAVVLVQKLLPPHPLIDAPLALAIVATGILVIVV